MLVDDLTFRKALGLGSADVVRSQNLKHRRSTQSRVKREENRGQRNHRQNHVVHDVKRACQQVLVGQGYISHPGNREDWEHQREGDQQQDTGPEYRRRIAKQREKRHEVAGNAIRIARRQYAQQDTNDQRQDLSGDDQQQGRGNPFEHQVQHRLIVEEGMSQIELQDFPDIGAKLNVEGLVQPVVFADLGQNFLVSATRSLCDGVGHIARGQVHHREIQHDHGNQQRDCVGHADQDHAQKIHE